MVDGGVTAIRDVVVIGAGPAGAATAARLHQQGVRDVLVLERCLLPRDKPCGGGLTGHIDEALAALDLRLTVPFVPSPAARVRYGTFERTVTMARPVQVIRRIEFDASLVAQIVARGVEVEKPKSSVGGDLKGTILVSVDQTGGIFVQGERYPDRASAKVALARLVAADPAAKAIVAGDARAAYGAIFNAVEACKQAGIASIALADDPLALGALPIGPAPP